MIGSMKMIIATLIEIKTGRIFESTGYWNGKGFELECPLCFAKLYIHSNDCIKCDEHEEHMFKL